MAKRKNLIIILCATFIFFSATLFAEDKRVGILVEKAPEREVFTCKYCGVPLSAGKIHTEANHIIENQIRNRLFYLGITPNECNESVERCIYVLIYRFQERIGGPYSVDKPASVGFHMHLLEEMRPIRSYTFDEEQKPLFSNLFKLLKFLKRKGRWVDASTLSEEGVIDGIKKIILEGESK
ncbi:MAG: hypothetical protein NZ583_02435 [Desulfobacterota bacterium]|nr:hypothetical protein [Thermodesulfobacteriota bacterium]MDW8001742.1 hypothetical protein [Deltaproteobacteria bacterium]